MLVKQKPNYRDITHDDYQAMAGPDWPQYEDFKSGCQIEEFVATEIDSMLRETTELKNKISNFCVLPFYGREYPTNSYCCLLPKDVNIDQVRADMINNTRTPACQKCWNLEDIGILSDRQLKNKTLDFYTDIDITKLYQNAVDGNYSITHYKISPGNYCNSTCVTCRPAQSTAWGELENKYNKKIIPMMLDSESSKIQVDYLTAKFIGFGGGESTMIRTNWDIIENLIKVGNTQCCISFVTNGSFNLTSKQKELLSQFKTVNFCFSIDGIGPVFEYLRYPLKWDKILNNVQWAKDQGYIVSVSYTISNLNILYHEQTIQWFIDNNIPYLENPVYDPPYFNPSSLSLVAKEQILEKTNNSTIKQKIQSHTKEDELNYQNFLVEIKRQDFLKEISINDYLPEFVKLLK